MSIHVLQIAAIIVFSSIWVFVGQIVVRRESGWKSEIVFVRLVLGATAGLPSSA